jgi:hypothetical protein
VFAPSIYSFWYTFVSNGSYDVISTTTSKFTSIIPQPLGLHPWSHLCLNLIETWMTGDFAPMGFDNLVNNHGVSNLIGMWFHNHHWPWHDIAYEAIGRCGSHLCSIHKHLECSSNWPKP